MSNHTTLNEKIHELSRFRRAVYRCPELGIESASHEELLRSTLIEYGAARVLDAIVALTPVSKADRAELRTHYASMRPDREGEFPAWLDRAQFPNARQDLRYAGLVRSLLLYCGAGRGTKQKPLAEWVAFCREENARREAVKRAA